MRFRHSLSTCITESILTAAFSNAQHRLRIGRLRKSLWRARNPLRGHCHVTGHTGCITSRDAGPENGSSKPRHCKSGNVSLRAGGAVRGMKRIPGLRSTRLTKPTKLMGRCGSVNWDGAVVGGSQSSALRISIESTAALTLSTSVTDSLPESLCKLRHFMPGSPMADSAKLHESCTAINLSRSCREVPIPEFARSSILLGGNQVQCG